MKTKQSNNYGGAPAYAKKICCDQDANICLFLSSKHHSGAGTVPFFPNGILNIQSPLTMKEGGDNSHQLKMTARGLTFQGIEIEDSVMY